MTRGVKATLWALLGVWASWITCSIIALSGSSIRPAAGSSGGAIAIDVLAVAITGDSSVAWALVGCRIAGAVMILIVVGLLIWYIRAEKGGPSQK
jgi:hypothetical protein